MSKKMWSLIAVLLVVSMLVSGLRSASGPAHPGARSRSNRRPRGSSSHHGARPGSRLVPDS